MRTLILFAALTLVAINLWNLWALCVGDGALAGYAGFALHVLSGAWLCAASRWLK